jgi:putative redox protein
VAEVLSAWASRYAVTPSEKPPVKAMLEPGTISVTETRKGKFQQEVQVGAHRLIADEPTGQGGNDTGPSPYDFLSIGLGACTAMTVRLYADFKKLPLEKVEVCVRHEKRHIDDCKDCIEGKEEKIDHFDRVLRFEGDLDDETRAKLVSIANRCPVHNTLEKGARIATSEERQTN